MHGVEGRPDLTGDLHVLLLVEPDRHHVGGQQQDVRGHQHRVAEDPAGDAVVVGPARGTVGGHRRLVGVGAVQQPLAGVAGEDPGQLEDLRQVRLPVQRRALWVQAQRQPGRRDLAGVAPQRLAVAQRRERVGVGDEVVGVGAGGQRQRRPDQAEEVAEVRPAARLDAGDRDRCPPDRRRPRGGRRVGLKARLPHGVAPCLLRPPGEGAGRWSRSANEYAAPSRGGRIWNLGCASALAAYVGDQYQRCCPVEPMVRIPPR